MLRAERHFKTRLFKDALPPVAVSGCGRYLAPGDGHDRCLSCLGIEHAEAALCWRVNAPIAGGWPSRGCGTRLRFLQRGGVPVPLPRSRVPPCGYRGEATSGVAGLVLRWQWGIPLKQRGLLLLPALRYRCLGNGLAPPMEGGYRLYPLALPPTIGCRSLHWRGESDQSGDDGSVPLPPSGRSAVPDSDPEMVAMLARAAESVGLEWRPPPCPEPSRLDDWFLGVAPRWFSGPHPGAFLPGSAWWAHWNMDGTFHCQKPLQWLILPPHPWRRSGAGVYRGPRRWSDRLWCNCVQGPLLPGVVIRCSPPRPVGTRRPDRQCLCGLRWSCFSPTRYGVVAGSPGQGTEGPARGWSRPRSSQWASDRHGPRAYGRRRLRRGLWPCDVHHGGPERHLWLCLADMKEVDKARFLNAPVSQTGLFGDAVENFAQQFSAAQKQTEAIRHILPRRAAAASTRPPAAVPRSTRRRGRPPAAAHRAADAAASSQAAPWSRPQGSRPARPGPRPNQAASVEASVPETDDPGMEMFALGRWWTHHSLPRRRAGRRIFCFLFCHWLHGQWYPKPRQKSSFLYLWVPQRGRGVVNESKLELHSPSSLASGQLWAVREGGQSHYSRTLCRNAGKCVTHADPASDRQRDARAGSLRSPLAAPTAGTSVGSLVSLVRFWGAWLALPNPSRWLLLRTIRLGYAIQFARRPPKYRGIHSTTVRAADAPHLASRRSQSYWRRTR